MTEKITMKQLETRLDSLEKRYGRFKRDIFTSIIYLTFAFILFIGAAVSNAPILTMVLLIMVLTILLVMTVVHILMNKRLMREKYNE